MDLHHQGRRRGGQLVHRLRHMECVLPRAPQPQVRLQLRKSPLHHADDQRPHPQQLQPRFFQRPNHQVPYYEALWAHK